jgi:hypothetical protein
MDVLTSSEFRKRYASLLRPTIVTVNGHPIGVWEPNKGVHEGAWRQALDTEAVPPVHAAAVVGFNSRPFTPVPKKARA